MASLSQISGEVSTLLGFQSQATEDAANVKSEQLMAAGAAGEETAYNTAAGVATQNESMALYASQLQQYGEARQVRQSAGRQQAQIASAGFANAGSALDIMRDSAAQGALALATTATQGSLTAGGFGEQANASTMSAQAAGVASSAATDLASSYAAAGQAASTNATNYGAALLKLHAPPEGTTPTSADNLVADIIKGASSGQFDVNSLTNDISTISTSDQLTGVQPLSPGLPSNATAATAAAFSGKGMPGSFSVTGIPTNSPYQSSDPKGPGYIGYHWT